MSFLKSISEELTPRCQPRHTPVIGKPRGNSEGKPESIMREVLLRKGDGEESGGFLIEFQAPDQ